MSIVTKQDLLERVPCVFKLVVLASRRAFDINAGAPTFIHELNAKATHIALEEIKAGKITYKEIIGK
ncbi:MAG: DNA-directed RNA polymerase subunit omega [Candidatus Omnitrophota bacterium]